MVTLSNLTTNTAVITPKLILCELQPVELTEEVCEKLQEENPQNELIDTLIIDKENLLKAEQREQLKDLLKRHGDMLSRNETDIGLLKRHGDMLSRNETDIGQCSSIKHRIDLTDSMPFKERHRRIPPAMMEEVRQHIEQLLAGGIIRSSKSP